MPYLQPWIDPNTGATFPQSYVRPSDLANIDTAGRQASFTVRRWASQTSYSLGYQPIEVKDVQVNGVAYGSLFDAKRAQAQRAFDSAIFAVADTYIGGLLTLSGAQVTP